MQEHSAIGEHILMRVDTYADIAKIVRFHHERIDGEGYPDGLSGDEIPLLSRIIAVADAYNAMTSDRPYRDAMPSRVARIGWHRPLKVSSTRRSWLHSKRFWLARPRTTASPAGGLHELRRSLRDRSRSRRV